MNPNDPPPDDSALPGVISDLARRARTSDVEGRRQAVEELYEIAYKVGAKGAAAIPVLIECLGDRDEKTGDGALWGLAYCEPHSIEPLIDCLDHVEPLVRHRAASALGNIGDEAIPASPSLRRLLRDVDQSVRGRAAWALGLIHDTDRRTVEALFAMVEHGVTLDRSAALHALGNIGKSLVDASSLREHHALVMSALDDVDSEVRWSALYVVESSGFQAQAHAQILLTILKQESSDRVIEAALSQLKTLAPRIDLSAHVETLCRCLSHAGRPATLACEVLAEIRPAPRHAIQSLLGALNVDALVLPAASALWKIDRRVKESLPAIARIFHEYDESVCDVICELGPAAAPLLPHVIEALGTENWDLQWAAADALGAIASAEPAVLLALQQALGHPSPIVRSATARALARVGEPSIPLLVNLLQDPEDTRSAWAAYALGEMGPVATAAAPQLRAGMRSPHQVLTRACAIALAQVTGDAEAIPHLLRILESEDPDCPRRAAAQALGKIGPAAVGAVEMLTLALDDEDPDVCAAAQEALFAIRARSH